MNETDQPVIPHRILRTVVEELGAVVLDGGLSEDDLIAVFVVRPEGRRVIHIECTASRLLWDEPTFEIMNRVFLPMAVNLRNKLA